MFSLSILHKYIFHKIALLLYTCFQHFASGFCHFYAKQSLRFVKNPEKAEKSRGLSAFVKKLFSFSKKE